ncbi:hypothetical protein CSQ88_16275 [Iodobacter sp. BJB302]|nr:hypothetical protein CSQ88_16275 [Iodobacter sp. BJB302]
MILKKKSGRKHNDSQNETTCLCFFTKKNLKHGQSLNVPKRHPCRTVKTNHNKYNNKKPW